MPTPPRRRWFRFSLRTLFLMMTVICVAVGVEGRKAYRHRNAERALENAGAHVTSRAIFWTRLPESLELGFLFSDSTVSFDSHTDIPVATALLADLRNVSVLCLDDTVVGDDEMTRIAQLSALRELWIKRTSISDSGCRHLQSLTQLRGLWISGCEITDSGAKSLSKLSRLEYLDISETGIGDDTLAELRSLDNLKVLILDGTSVTNVGIRHLVSCPSLSKLELSGTKVTEAAWPDIYKIKTLTGVGGLNHPEDSEGTANDSATELPFGAMR